MLADGHASETAGEPRFEHEGHQPAARAHEEEPPAAGPAEHVQHAAEPDKRHDDGPGSYAGKADSGEQAAVAPPDQPPPAVGHGCGRLRPHGLGRRTHGCFEEGLVELS